MTLKAWKNGRLETCDLADFVANLRVFAKASDEEFSTSSHFMAHIGERLNAAADAIASNAQAPTSQDIHDVKVLLQAIYDLIDDEEVAEPLDYAIAHAKKALTILGASPHSSTDEKSPVLNWWKLDRPECPRCRGHGRVGIMACNDCGATGVVVSSTHKGGGK